MLNEQVMSCSQFTKAWCHSAAVPQRYQPQHLTSSSNATGIEHAANPCRAAPATVRAVMIIQRAGANSHCCRCATPPNQSHHTIQPALSNHNQPQSLISLPSCLQLLVSNTILEATGTAPCTCNQRPWAAFTVVAASSGEAFIPAAHCKNDKHTAQVPQPVLPLLHTTCRHCSKPRLLNPCPTVRTLPKLYSFKALPEHKHPSNAAAGHCLRHGDAVVQRHVVGTAEPLTAAHTYNSPSTRRGVLMPASV